MANKMDVRSNLAEIFLKSIEEQPLSWNKNFRSAKRPVNGIYKNKYKGYNRMLLSYVMNQRDIRIHVFIRRAIFSVPLKTKEKNGMIQQRSK